MAAMEGGGRVVRTAAGPAYAATVINDIVAKSVLTLSAALRDAPDKARDSPVPKYS